MFKLIIRFSIISLVAYMANANPMEDDTLTVPSIEQDLPLILIKRGNHLELPTGVQVVKEGMLKKKKIQFTNDFYSENRFFCPSENNKQRNKLEKAMKLENQESDIMGEKVDEYCLMKKKGTKQKPIPSCENVPQPKIMRALEMKQTTLTKDSINQKKRNQEPIYEQITCGPSNIGKYFSFGYMICVEFGGMENLGLFMYNIVHKESPPLKKTGEISMYEFCYNERRNEIMYTIHAITAPKLLFKNYLKEERKKTWNSIETYNSPHLPAIDFKEVNSAFKQVESHYPYKIQLLIPQEDFPFLLWKRPVSHSANTNLMHKDLQSCWNNIHDMIRKHAIEHLDHFDIYTGAFKLPENGKVYTLMKVEIPTVWVKIVHHNLRRGKKSAVAIIANNYRDETIDKVITEMYKCKVNICIPDSIVEKCSDISNHIRCCKLTTEIIKLFGEKIEFSEVLEIDELIVADYISQIPKLKKSITSPPRVT